MHLGECISIHYSRRVSDVLFLFVFSSFFQGGGCGEGEGVAKYEIKSKLNIYFFWGWVEGWRERGRGVKRTAWMSL